MRRSGRESLVTLVVHATIVGPFIYFEKKDQSIDTSAAKIPDINLSSH